MQEQLTYKYDPKDFENEETAKVEAGMGCLCILFEIFSGIVLGIFLCNLFSDDKES